MAVRSAKVQVKRGGAPSPAFFLCVFSAARRKNTLKTSLRLNFQSARQPQEAPRLGDCGRDVLEM